MSQFARCLPPAEALSPELIVAAAAEMAPIPRQLIDEHRIHEDWDSLPDVQVRCALSGLPRLFGTNLKNIPAVTPHLGSGPVPNQIMPMVEVQGLSETAGRRARLSS